MAISRLKQETSGRTRHRKGQPSAVTDWEMIRKRRQEREKHRQTTSNRHKKTKVNDMQQWRINTCGLEKRGVEEKCSVHHGRSPGSLSLKQHN